jgi:hypothetical protein
MAKSPLTFSSSSTCDFYVGSGADVLAAAGTQLPLAVRIGIGIGVMV